MSITNKQLLTRIEELEERVSKLEPKEPKIVKEVEEYPNRIGGLNYEERIKELYKDSETE